MEWLREPKYRRGVCDVSLGTATAEHTHRKDDGEEWTM
jgi:hypothetical protein